MSKPCSGPGMTSPSEVRRNRVKEVLSWLFRWARRAATLDFCSALAALVSPVQDISYLTAPFFTFLIPIAQQPWQSVVQGRLSLCLCSIPSKQIH
jgi:hypothetical protein